MITGQHARMCRCSGRRRFIKGVNVEKQTVSLLKGKNHWGMTALCIVVCTVLSPVLGITMFMPQALAVTPLLLMAMLAYVGPVSAAVCSVVLAALGSMLFGVWGGVAVLLLITPVVLVSSLAIERGQPFWQAVAAGGVTMFASAFALVAMLSMIMGSDVVTALTQTLRQALAASGSLGDAMLSMMIQMGVIRPSEEAQIAANGILTIDPELRREIVSSLVRLTDTALRLEIPMQMATASVACGLLGQAVLRKGLLRSGRKVEYPPLRTWRVPSGWGRILGGTLLLLYVCAQLLPASMNTMLYVFSGVFDQVFALQGVAVLCYVLHKRGKPHRWQAVVFVLGYFVFGQIAVMLGIADQAMDFSHRRSELEEQENPFDPRRGSGDSV